MIDYEKLKIAHELGNKLTEYTGCFTKIYCQLGSPFQYTFGFEVCNNEGEQPFPSYFTSLDGLIEKIQSLTKPELDTQTK